MAITRPRPPEALNPASPAEADSASPADGDNSASGPTGKTGSGESVSDSESEGKAQESGDRSQETGGVRSPARELRETEEGGNQARGHGEGRSRKEAQFSGALATARTVGPGGLPASRRNLPAHFVEEIQQHRQGPSRASPRASPRLRVGIELFPARQRRVLESLHFVQLGWLRWCGGPPPSRSPSRSYRPKQSGPAILWAMHDPLIEEIPCREPGCSRLSISAPIFQPVMN
jgi:hypothetical protein